MTSLMQLLDMVQKPWQEPLCSLAKEAFESLMNSQYVLGVTGMLLRAACYRGRYTPFPNLHIHMGILILDSTGQTRKLQL